MVQHIPDTNLFIIPLDLLLEIEHWCHDNGIGWRVRADYDHIYGRDLSRAPLFVDLIEIPKEIDAIHFKLRWV